MLKIKVCGMREPQNIQAVAAMGLQYMGFIFYENSSRFVGADFKMPVLNNEIFKVGVFVNEENKRILELVQCYGLQMVQLHGNETPGQCKELLEKVKVMKAIAVDEDIQENIKLYESCCDQLLFDTATKSYGGSGKKFDWSVLSGLNITKPWMLSGGIEENDAEQIKRVQHPMLIGVDINSRFEIQPGLKEVEKIKKFIHELSGK